MGTAPYSSLPIGNQWVSGDTAPPTNIPGGPGIPAMTPQEKETPVREADAWSDTRAAQIALGDFQRMEAYRTINHDWRFRTSDQLYLAWTQRKTWEGTKLPRSSVGIFLAYEQIEALLPNVIGALFPDNNQLPFDVEPMPTSTMDQAQAVRNLIAYQLQDIGDYGKFLSLRELVRRAYKSSYIYGNGIVECCVLDKMVTRTQFERVQVPIRQTVAHPLTGEPVGVPTGQFRSVVHRNLAQEHIVRPSLFNVDIRDWYIDPNCSSHNIQDASCCAVRSLPTINQLKEYANIQGMRLPDDAGLLKLANIKTTVQGDTSKQQTEAFRGMSWQPSTDYTTDPNLARVELIRYFQKNRYVWILGRQWVAYNQPNQYGILPFLDAFYSDVPGRFYGLSICDLVEGDQKLAEAIINGRIDELNLMIHPPIIKKQGRGFSAAQQRLRPGVIWDAEDPSKDFVRFEMGNVTQAAYVEVDALERRVQKKTGITDLAVLGSPGAGGNSANRSATGISTQSSASGKRIEYLVQTIEDQFMVPALNLVHALNQVFLPEDEMVRVLGPQAQLVQIDPVQIFNASVRFKLNASSKLRTRQMLQGGGLAIILQSLLNPEMIQLNMQMGRKLDMGQVDRLINDTFGLPAMALWADMSQQEQQQFMMQKMMPEMLKRQMQQDRLQSHAQVSDDKDETMLLKELISKLLTPDAAHALINDMFGTKLTLPSDIPPPTQQGQGE